MKHLKLSVGMLNEVETQRLVLDLVANTDARSLVVVLEPFNKPVTGPLLPCGIKDKGFDQALTGSIFNDVQKVLPCLPKSNPVFVRKSNKQKWNEGRK